MWQKKKTIQRIHSLIRAFPGTFYQDLQRLQNRSTAWMSANSRSSTIPCWKSCVINVKESHQIFFLVSWGVVRLESIWNAYDYFAYCISFGWWLKIECGAIDRMTDRKPIPVLCPPQIAMTYPGPQRWKATAWVMEWPLTSYNILDFTAFLAVGKLENPYLYIQFHKGPITWN
jgi:hypothetical protein